MQRDVISPRHSTVRLHADILDILFKHKKEISTKLNNMRNLAIDYACITILNPLNELIVFSTTPSVEYNLITQELWQYDHAFSPAPYQEGTFFWWDDAYTREYKHRIKEIKEMKHHYALGFCLALKIDKLHLIYSYATRSKEKNLKNFFLTHKNELLLLGDNGFKLLRDIYYSYYPSLLGNSAENKEKKLTLIVNNLL